MVDTPDLKSVAANPAWGFESPLPYHAGLELVRLRSEQVKWPERVTHVASGHFDANFDANVGVLTLGVAVAVADRRFERACG